MKRGNYDKREYKIYHEDIKGHEEEYIYSLKRMGIGEGMTRGGRDY